MERPLTAESCPTCGHSRRSDGGGLGGGGSNSGSSILHVSYVNGSEVPNGGTNANANAAPKFEKSPTSPPGDLVMAARSSQVRERERVRVVLGVGLIHVLGLSVHVKAFHRLKGEFREALLLYTTSN